MAFVTTNPPSLISQRTGASGGGNLWAYVDGDDLGVVAVSGYFTNGYANYGMRAGDEVIHHDTTNDIVNHLTMTTHTKGTASGATCSAIEPITETSIALSSAGTGTIVENDVIEFSTDPGVYYVVTNAGDTDVSDGGTLTVSPGLAVATAVGTAITVQSNVLRAKAQNTKNVKALTVASTLLLSDSGTTFTLGTAGGFTTTLPVPMEGVNFKFVVLVAPTTAYIILSSSATNIIHGQVGTSEDAAGSVACAAASDTITFVANKAIIGDWISVESDGTNWYIDGMCDVQDAITTTQAA